MIRQEYLETVIGNPPDGWTLGHVTLNLRNPDERIPVEAWRRSSFAIHEKITADHKQALLTHTPTGMLINAFATMDDAAECAERLEPLTDWSAIKAGMPAGSELFPKVRAVVEEIQDRTDPRSPQENASE
jgi:hypothetical protein